MCGRLNVSDDPFVRGLYQALGFAEDIHFLHSRFIRAAAPVSIVRSDRQHGRVLQTALWWLLLDKTEQGFKPGKYTSFNSRYDKITQPGSASYLPFKQSRCVFVVRGFGETQVMPDKRTMYHDFIGDQCGLLLGGVCRSWRHPNTGEEQWSCSVITLPPHPKLAPYHSKSMPLILPQQGNWLDAWLDPTLTDIQPLLPLLTPALANNLTAVPIDKPGSFTPVGEPFSILADA